MRIPMVPFAGRMSYCLIKSIQMVLANQGHEYAVPWLECISGEPFGFAYIRSGQRFFAVNGYEYHLAGEHLLRALNYDFTYTSAESDESALAALREALQDGPVVVGMLDMGYLTYSPTHQYARGADHAIVVLELSDAALTVHDPDGYVATQLPLSDFLEAWRRDIYTGKPYGLWRIGAQGIPRNDDEIWQITLNRARENFARPRTDLGDQQILCGPEAITTLAEDIRTREDIPIDGLAYFSWRVSNQRCFDSAIFVRERLPKAAAIRWEQSKIYGRLQLATVAGQRAALPPLLEQLAEHEARFIAAIA